MGETSFQFSVLSSISQFSIFNFQFRTLVLVEFLCKPNAVELAPTAEAQPKMGAAKMVSELSVMA